MPGEPADNSQEIACAFAEHDRQVTVSNIQIGCFLGMVLMPAGFLLDWFVYSPFLWQFLGLRLLCSLLIGVFWLVVISPWGRKRHRQLGVTLAMFPTAFISLMIEQTDGWNSRYYAGLNLVLLVVAFVLHWTFLESLVALLMVICMYITACLMNGAASLQGVWFNNLYFIVLTGIIVITGSYFQSRLRFREFAASFQLNKSRLELEASNRKLIELDEVKGRFFANISHELRTPLTLLLAPLESLIRQSPAGMDPQSHEWLQTMQNNGMRLLKLINDLLDLVRLESGKIQLKVEKVAIGEFLTGLSTSIRKVAEDKRVRLIVNVQDSLPTVPVDRDKLEKIILNLLFNAIKFTPSGGQITLGAQSLEESLILTVTDTGVGIAAEQMPHVFDRFWQADTSSQRKHQGAGIGLALVKELVEAHGGKVEAQSAAGKGTTMTVTLPLSRADDADKPVDPALTTSMPVDTSQDNAWLDGLYRRAELFPSMTSPRDAILPVEMPGRHGQHTVLVADDEPDMLRFLKSQLSRHYQVLEAVDGQQAVEKAAQFLPDVLLVDMMMPGKDGLQVCKELRERTSTQAIPIMMLTARADEQTKLAVLSAGANDFLTKPFSGTELHVRLKNLVQAHQLQRDLARQNKILAATLEQLKETESELVQVEKMASLGRMSAGIIHEINNPLNFAKTGLFTLKSLGQELPEDRRALYEEILKDIQEGVDRVKNIVSDLRTFTHPKADHYELIRVEPALTAALRFLSHEWKDKVQIDNRVPEGFSIWGNHNKIVQVLVNLLQNSLDALRESQPPVQSPRIEIEGREERGRRLLVIRDNGPGISDADQMKIFDPFFTTKDVGQGMGLGLSICYRIVEEHHGRIVVRSEAGCFCEFTLDFPLEVPEST